MKKLVAALICIALLIPAFAVAEPPKAPQKVICLTTAITGMFNDLGITPSLIAVDSFAPQSYEWLPDLTLFDMLAPDYEAMAALEPDVVIVSEMSFVDGVNPLQPLIDMGVNVVIITASDSIEGIYENLRPLGELFAVEARAEEIIAETQATIDAIAEIGATITDKKSVFFEIGALPYLYSFGKGTFLNELIEIVGATNAMGANDSWMSVTEEAAIDANPDVILTNVNYIDDPVGEILSRAGWDSVTAIANGDVYYIDTNSSSQANQYAINALIEIALAVYPDAYAAYAE